MDQYLRGGGRLSLHRARRARSEIVLYRGLNGSRATGPGSPDDRHGYADHRRGRTRRRHARVTREGDDHPAAAANRRDSGVANRPNFDLNLRAEAKPEEMKNRAIIDMMEPGSTFKIVTAAAAINERKSRSNRDFLRKRCLECRRPAVARPRPQGLWRPECAGHPRPFEQHRRGQDGGDAGRAKVLRIHPPFGFGDRTGVELPGEIGGVVHSPKSWSKISITRIPMGQEVGVTPLQMIMAMATVANGGKLSSRGS